MHDPVRRGGAFAVHAFQNGICRLFEQAHARVKRFTGRNAQITVRPLRSGKALVAYYESRIEHADLSR